MTEKRSPSRLIDLVTYQAGSVVSKTLLVQKTGTVTLFAFDQDQGLSEHTAPFDAMVCVLDGTGEVTIGGEAITMGVGEMIVMPAGIPHAVRAPERFKMMLTMIRT